MAVILHHTITMQKSVAMGNFLTRTVIPKLVVEKTALTTMKKFAVGVWFPKRQMLIDAVETFPINLLRKYAAGQDPNFN